MSTDSTRFTYAVSFPALIAATAQEAVYWNPPKGIQGGILFFIVPVVLGILNSFGVEVGRCLQFGTLKTFLKC